MILIICVTYITIIIVLDLREGRWQELTPMIIGRGYTAGCIGRDGLVYTVGGISSVGRFVRSIELYDSRRNAWELLSESAAEDHGSSIGRACHHALYLI
jgi:hypothetical protein